MGAGLPAAGTASGAMLGHTSRGTACTRAHWKHLLEHAAPLALGFPGKPWLPALQLECAAISGSPPGRGGPGDRVNLSVQLLSFGKKGKSQAQPELTCPMQQSSLSQEPELPQAWGHCSLPTKTCSGHIPHLPRTPKPALAQASAGQLTAPCNTLRVRTEGQAFHWCPEKAASACAPSYQPSLGEPTGGRQRGSTHHLCPSGGTWLGGTLTPFADSRLESRLPGELGWVIRLGRAPENR